MKKPHQDDQDEPFFIAEDVAAELTASGYEFAPPGHTRTASTRELFGWQPGETLSEAVSRHQESCGTKTGVPDNLIRTNLITLLSMLCTNAIA